MLKKLSVCLAFCVLLISGVAQAADKKAEVTAMLAKAAAHYEAVGAEQAMADFSKKDSDYNKGEYYVIIQNLDDGNVKYHAVNEKLIGKNLNKVKDTDGKQFVMDMIEVARGPGIGWVDYKWPHPTTKKITQKHTLVQRVGDVFLMIGYYD